MYFSDLFSTKKRYLLHVVFWVFLLLLMLTLQNTVLSFSNALKRGILNFLLMIPLFYSQRIIIKKYYIKNLKKTWFIIAFLICAVAAVIRTPFEVYYFKMTMYGNYTFTKESFSAKVYMCLFYFTCAIILSSVAAFYQVAKLNSDAEKNYQQLKIKHIEAQLNYLRSQLNPHFLFNTLHNIYSAVQLKSNKAGEMIIKLSSLLHYVTYEGQMDKVLLEEEIEQMKVYLDLFELKSNLKLPIELEIKGLYENIKIDPVLLLPLVENALKHGNLTENSGNPFLKIYLEITSAFISLKIENTFDPKDLQKDKTGGVGLENIKQRLHLLYPDNHNFNHGVVSNNVYFVYIKITRIHEQSY